MSVSAGRWVGEAASVGEVGELGCGSEVPAGANGELLYALPMVDSEPRPSSSAAGLLPLTVDVVGRLPAAPGGPE